MRLRVTVQRHALPAVNLLFNSSTSHTQTGAPIVTIADLLSALDTIVPLESADGEWGLEEYTVVVKTGASLGIISSSSSSLHGGQGHKRSTAEYECLHFQNVVDVLREDDEILVRGLTSEELKERRLGGRLQISGDGRRLYDGVAWGKRFRGSGYIAHRPDIVIPPRKKRRLLEDQDNDKNVQPSESWEVARIPQKRILIGDDSDEDDSDEDDDEEDDGDYTDDEGSMDENASLGDSEEESGVESDSDVDSHSGLKILVKDKGEQFDGFPLTSNINTPSSSQSQKDTRQKNRVHKEVNDEASSEQSDSSAEPPYNDESESDTETVTNLQVVRIAPASVDYTSSSGSSSTGSHSESESDSASDLSPDAADLDLTSSSGSDSSSDSDSESESESELDSESSSATSESHEANKNVTPRNLLTQSLTAGAQIAVGKRTPPGQGSRRTKMNNDRAKRRKRLLHLKETGELPPEANFNDLREYDRDHPDQNGEELDFDDPVQMASRAAGLDQKRKELLARVNGNLSDDSIQVPSSQPEPISSSPEIAEFANKTAGRAAVSAHFEHLNNRNPENNLPTTDAQDPAALKRTRLDIGSSRRMIFGSLGLRNPKTQAAEEAIRDKLIQEAREIETKHSRRRENSSHAATTISGSTVDSWRNKVVVTAFECVQEGLLLKPPPFPFRQDWDKYLTDQEAEDEYVGEPDLKQPRGYEPQKTRSDYTRGTEKAAPVEDEALSPQLSRTISAGHTDPEDIPYTDDVNHLPQLSREDIARGAVIAYKELHMNSRFEPEESSYRTARVLNVVDDNIQVKLSKRDLRELAGLGQYDKFGQRIYHGFELPNADEESDDGYRELSFLNLIGPRLVKPAEVSTLATTSGLVRPQLESDMVPESVPQDQSSLEIDSSHKNELSSVIADADMNTQASDKLLQLTSLTTSELMNDRQPNPQASGPGTHRENSTDINSVLRYDWASSSIEPDQSMMFDTPQAVGDRSSPMHETSPPTISLVETVDYPHVSRIELGESSSSSRAEDNSLQDAQRVSPNILDNTNLQSQLGFTTTGEIQGVEGIPAVNVAQNYKKVNFLQHDKGEFTSLDQTENGWYTDDESLPSLHTLTTSQKYRAKDRRPEQISPPLLGKERRRTGKEPTEHQSVEPVAVNNAGDQASSAEEGSEHAIVKISNSQAHIQLDQVPFQNKTALIDLTLSSDPVAPDDDTDGNEKDHMGNAQTNVNNTRANSRQIAKGTAVVNSQAAKMMQSALAGMGSRRSLSGKKGFSRRSLV